MDDPISKQSVIDAITDENIIRNMDSVMDSEMHRVKRSVHRIIASIPSAQPDMAQYLAYENGRKQVEQKTGKWIPAGLDENFFVCSVCKTDKAKIARAYKKALSDIYKYCPNCGARMTEVKDEPD